jgi:hypothetical protein
VAAREGNWVKISEPVFGFCTVSEDEGHQILEKGDFSTVAKFRYRVVVRGNMRGNLLQLSRKLTEFC